MSIETNSLHQFSSFNTIFTMSCLTRDEIAVPNETYRAYGPQNVILRSGGGAGDNKVTTEYEDIIGGKLEYFIDNVNIEALCVPNSKSRSTNATFITFTVEEPYSMGLFLQTCQIAATISGFQNYANAPFMLSMEFIGYDDDGDVIVTESGLNLRRDVPIKLTNIEFEVNQGGTTYTVEALPWNEQAYLDNATSSPVDIALTGNTVEKLLQSGEQSLTTIINGHYEELRKANQIAEASEIVITFPKDIASSGNPSRIPNTSDAGATTASRSGGGGGGGGGKGGKIFGAVAAGVVGGVVGGLLGGNSLKGSFNDVLGGIAGGLDKSLGGLLSNFKSGNIQGLFENISGFLGAQAPQNFEAFLSMITGQVLTKSSIGEQLSSIAQDPASLNNLGSARIISGAEESGTVPMPQTGQVYDRKNKVMTRAKNTVSNDERVFNYGSGTSILKIIEDVILTSDWGKSIKERAPDENGMVPWFRIDAESYLKPNAQQENVFGEDAKVNHYKVVEYKVHSSHFQNAGAAGVDYNSLRQNAKKEYKYIYSGENTDIVRFDISFKAAFFQFIQPDSGQLSIDAKTGGTQFNLTQTNPSQLGLNITPSGSNSSTGLATQGFVNSSSTQGGGGAGIDNSKIRWARKFHDQILGNGSVDLVEVKLEIFGDPYFIVDSGMGNWTDEAGDLNTTAGGQVDYQRSEVDVILNFRTPIDYNPDTGGMIYPEDTVPVSQFNGLYRVTAIENKIQRNMFTQELTLLRRRGQPEDTNTSGTSDQANKVKDANRASQVNTGFNS
jgi:hypothetical protein